MMVFGFASIVAVCAMHATTVLGINDTCYSYLGCFPMGSPWSTTLRPVPPPQAPDVIDTAFYLYTRNQPTLYNITKLPDISLAGSDYDGSRPTFLIAHGLSHTGSQPWIIDLKNAYLDRVDANFIIVDWGKGAALSTFMQVISNPRVVAAETARLLNYLIATQGADVSRIHLTGHSLGAHVMSYVGKAIPNIARITAFDAAQPGFEGYVKDIRLDASDALFVEVIHNNALPFVPLFGFGMMGSYGHVDFYMNGGGAQPACVVPEKLENITITSPQDITYASWMVIQKYVSCSHGRSYWYFIDSLARPNCTFWGRRNKDIIFNLPCSATSCSPFGLESVNYQARGAFTIFTNFFEPYCWGNKGADTTMSQFRAAKAVQF